MLSQPIGPQAGRGTALIWLLSVSLCLSVQGGFGLKPLDCTWSTQGGVHVLSNCNLQINVTTGSSFFSNTSGVIGREPIQWLPMRLQQPTLPALPSLLTDSTLQLPTCASLWELAVMECTFLASRTWPSPGLQSGPAYLFYQRLEGLTSTAERVNITCPPDDWDALLATRGSSSEGGVPALAPCGTATVTTGQQLLDALERLQPLHARVLVTLAANMSLPTEPTPQRLMAPPDDTQPLVRIYRNVTLAGGARLDDSGGVREGSSMGGTELDVRMRRNAFDLTGGPPKQQGKQQEQQSQGRPVLVLADLHLVNRPPGPLDTWPLGLLSSWHYFIGADRSGSGGIQVMLLRSLTVYTPGEFGYINYWYGRMMSLEGSSAAWLSTIMGPLKQAPDADGHTAILGNVLDFLIGYNSSIAPTPLLTPASKPDFALWSTNTTTWQSSSSPVPPSSIAVALNSQRLLSLLQESWTDGSRIILLVANVTLRPGEWPQAGAVLSYNVTLAGPVAGAPVWLDTAGMRLLATAPAATTPGAVTMRLQRLRLVGFAPPLLAAGPREVAEADAQGAMAGSQELVAWKDRCLQQRQPGGGSEIAPTTKTARYSIGNSALELPAAVMEVLWLFNNPEACTSAYLGTTTNNNTATAAAVVCELLLLAKDGSSSSSASSGAALRGAGQLAALLVRPLAVVGQVIFGDAANGSGASSSRSITFTSATLSGVTLSNTIAVEVAESTPPVVMTSAAAGGGSGAGTDDPPCGAMSLLLAVRSRPPPAPDTPDAPGALYTASGGGRVPLAAVVGGAVAAALLCLAAVVVGLMMMRRRRRQQRHKTPGHVLMEPPPVVVEGGGDEGPAVGVILAGSGGRSKPAGRAEGLIQEAANNGAGGAGELDDDRFSLSFEAQQQHGDTSAAGTTTAGQTMADILLGATGAAAYSRARYAAAAAVGGMSGNNPRVMKRTSPEVRPPTRINAASLRSTVTDEINKMMRMCQVVALAGGPPSSGGGSARRGRMPLLGRGAHGAVYLGEWRGLPTAVKVIVLGAGESAQPRERLAREVALTSTLNHPNIVPTYHFSLDAIRAAGSASTTETSSPARPACYDGVATEAYQHLREPDTGMADLLVDGDEEDDEEVVALRLRLVMQYCEGGTLGSSLRTGKFGKSVWPGKAPTVPSPAANVVAATAKAAPDSAMERAPAAAARATGAADAATIAGVTELEPQLPPQLVQRLDEAGAPMIVDNATNMFQMTQPPWCPTTWKDLSVARNLPLSLLAALDVLRGLEYLHSCGVIHGDLTENNILLKAVQPALPPQTPSAPLSSGFLLRFVIRENAIAHARAVDQPPLNRASPGNGYVGGGDTCGGGSAAITSGESRSASLVRCKPAGPQGDDGGGHPRGVGEPGLQLQQAQQMTSSTDLDSTAVAECRFRSEGGEDVGEMCFACEDVSIRDDGASGVHIGPGSRLQERREQRMQGLQQHPRQQQQPGTQGGEARSTVLIITPHGNKVAGRLHRIIGNDCGSGTGSGAATPAMGLVSNDDACDEGWSFRTASRFRSSSRSDRLAAGANNVIGSTVSGAAADSSHLAAWSVGDVLPTAQAPTTGAAVLAAVTAELLMSWAFKISDFGLSMQFQGDPQTTHISNMAQGTPIFAAPEVVLYGHLSPAADIYSFGVVLWLLLHGVSLGQVRHLLPFALLCMPVNTMLLDNAAAGLPAAARDILHKCMATRPADRPPAAELRRQVEGLLQEVVGPDLSQLLLGVERREFVTAPKSSTK